MAIGDDTYATRRHLPHLVKRDKSYFVTFATVSRRFLTSDARTIALECCVHDHEVTYWLDVAVIMPDHVHMIFTPYEKWSLSEIMKRVKGNSSRLINLILGRKGQLWQDESFDRIVRDSEDFQNKCEYVAENPVRAGLCDRVDDYRWVWRSWVEGKKKNDEDRQDSLSSPRRRRAPRL